MHISSLTILFCTLSLICAFEPSWPSSYLTIPFTSLSSPGMR